MRRIMSIILATILLVICAGIALFLYSPEDFWRRLAGDADLGPVEFETLRKSPKPNQYLVCPDKLCAYQEPDEVSKIYPYPATILKERLMAVIGTDIEIVENSDHAIRFIVRTPTMRFPDTVSIRVFDVVGGSALAIYSRSKLGYMDFRANETRVKRWLAALEIQPL